MTAPKIRGLRRGRRLALVLALALVVAACSDDGDGSGGGATSTTVGTPVTGGDLVVGIEAESDGLNPTTNAFAVSGTLVASAVFDTMTKFDENGEAKPFLAESLAPNDDYTEWTITLRPGITFHDGTPLTSEAIKATIDAQRASPLVGIAVRPVLADPPVEIVDELSATVKLTRPLPYFPSYLTTQLGMVASPTWLAASAEDASLNQRPVGVGPFMFDSRTLNARTKLVRNPDYWQEGLPYLDSVTFVVATDPQARAQNIKAGDFDVIHTNRDEDILEFRDDDGVSLFEDTEGEETFVMLNVSKPPFDDVRPRQALAHATDRETVAQLLGSGIVTVANSMFFPGSTYDTGVDNFPAFDPEEGKRIAAEFCADVPESCDGDRISFEFKSTPSPENQEVVQTLSEMWKDVANVSATPVEQAQYIQDAALGGFQAVLWRQFGAVNPDSDMLWLDSESIGPVISLNWSRNSDPEIDEWLDEQRVSLDLEERIDLWGKISRKLNEDLPFIWLNHTLWGIVARPDVQGLDTPEGPDGGRVRAFSNGRFEVGGLWLAK